MLIPSLRGLTKKAFLGSSLSAAEQAAIGAGLGGVVGGGAGYLMSDEDKRGRSALGGALLGAGLGGGGGYLAGLGSENAQLVANQQFEGNEIAYRNLLGKTLTDADDTALLAALSPRRSYSDGLGDRYQDLQNRHQRTEAHRALKEQQNATGIPPRSVRQ